MSSTVPEHSEELERTWQIGESVWLRGEVWTIAERTRFTDCETLRVRRAAGAATESRTVLLPFDRPRPRTPKTPLRTVSARRCLHCVRRLGCAAHPFGSLTAAAGTSIRLLPYQLEPALAMLRHGAARMMIADAVGLGKTVQAGVILNELAAASAGFRAMIVVPAGLRDQWARELTTHFGLTATVADAPWLARMGRELPPGINPWALPGVFLSSFDFIKRPEVLRPLEDLLWDALVVDEVHGATRSTARRAAVHAIGVRSARVVLLTATPHSGDPQEFRSLCGIGADGSASDRLLLFRRSRAEGGAATGRRSAVLPVRLSRAELRMHRLLEAYASRVCRESRARHDASARLAAIVLEKRALSSAASLAASAGRRLDLLSGTPGSGALQLALPLDDEAADDDVCDSVLAPPGLADPARERRLLSAVAGAAGLAARDESKVRVLLRLLSRIGEAVIVFTEYRDTLTRLRCAISAQGHRVTVLHGGLTPSERSESQRAFNAGGGVLVATDAASEGLNLHSRCRVVVHFELPWSPARLEQRTGRVDRVGQQRTVHEILLVADDTAERLVLVPLLRRAARAVTLAGGAAGAIERLAETRIALAMMEGENLDPVCADDLEATAVQSPPPGLAAEAAIEADRLAEHRAWHARSRARVPDRPGVFAASIETSRASRRPNATAVYAISAATACGSAIHREIVAVRLPPDGPRGRRPLRARCREFLEGPESCARQAVQAWAAGRLRRAADAHAAAIHSREHRAHAMAGITSSVSEQLVQAGLFDRRALRAEDLRRAAAAVRRAETDRRVAALEDERELNLSIELAAVLFSTGRS